MQKRLRAGILEMVYQDGFLRYITLGEIEVIRMINHALRDHNWGTIPMEILEEHITENDRSFHIQYQARFQQGDIDFHLRCEISGSEDNELSFRYQGKAQSSFRRNRIGFTVLHPIHECAGSPIEITHTDGSISKTHFPNYISPHQPFMNIKGMNWKPGQEAEAILEFEGDVFETEDQRNWTDASFKTYCTPLGIPFPVRLEKEDEVNQKICLKVKVKQDSFVSLQTDKVVLLKWSEDVHEFPRLGTELKPGFSMEGLSEIADFDFVRIELPLDRDYSDALRLLENAEKSGLNVEICVFTDNPNWPEELEKLEGYLRPVDSLLVFSESQKTCPKNLTDQIPKCRNLFPHWQFLSGTDAFFTELNREPVDDSYLDGVSYSVNPQVHAFDDASLVETLEAQSYTVQSCRKHYPSQAIKISPVTYHMRWNPNATDSDMPLRNPTGLTDPRQFSFFGACWWLISLKYLAESGVSSVTYFEAFGEKGWVKHENGKLYKSPAFQLWEEIRHYKGGIIRKIRSSSPLLVDGIVFEKAQQSFCYLVNWSDQTQAVRLPEIFQPIKYCLNGNDLKWRDWKTPVEHPYNLMPKSLTILVNEPYS